jgi:hypothetical protein
MIRQHFLVIKRQFFPRWDRDNRWRVSTRSKRRVHGYCDTERRVIEIVFQFSDPDERDKILIHETCHAVADVGHGKKWQDRIEIAAKRADELGRHRLAQILRQEIADYQDGWRPVDEAYGIIREWLTCNPDLTLSQVKRSLADQYGMLVSEVGKKLRRTEKVFREAKREALEERALREAWLKETDANNG